MNRIGSNYTKNDAQPDEPNSCELPGTASQVTPAASDPGSSINIDDTGFADTSFVDAVCADTGLQGMPTASQRYLANFGLTRESAAPLTPRDDTVTAPSMRSQPAGVTPIRVEQLVKDASSAILDALRTAVASCSLETVQKLERAIELPNGCKAKFSIAGELKMNPQGAPELVIKVSGSVEAKLGAVSAEAAFNFTRSHSGQETFSLGACVFGGLDQEAAGLFEVEGKAGVCATLVDTSGEPALLNLEVVAKTGANINIGTLTWGHEAELRAPLATEPLPYELLR